LKVKKDIDRVLHQTFGHSSFRSGQRGLIDSILGGRDVVAVMPTGSGKSLCYQLPAVLLEGTTVVVSPLIALMKDQLDGLRERGVPAAAIHSGLPTAARSSALEDLAAGLLRMVYIAPERLSNRAFCDALGRARVARLVIDEAHCISQWGHDFRPDYMRLGGLRSELDVPVAAFTATATPDVRADIVRQLGLRDAVELVAGFERPNLTLAVESCRTHAEKGRSLEKILKEVGPPGIVYAATRKNTEKWTDFLRILGVETETYHAGLSDHERRRAQDLFLSGRVPVIVATNAFGMGVDKADIRFVVHADLPGSVEAYYQEVGRAGRDGQPSRCSLLFSPADVRTQEFFLAGSNPSEAVFRIVWGMLGDGASNEVIETRVGGTDAARGMAAMTAARLLRRAAEAASVRPGEGEPPIDMRARAEKARRDRERLDTMMRYAFSRGCRTQFVYDYFAGSARGEALPRCGTCDVCLGWRQSGLRPPDDEEYLQIRIALSAVARLSGRFGAVRIAQVLVGSRAKEVLNWRLDRIPTYGKLSDCSLDQAKELLNLLADSGLVERRTLEGGKPGTFVLALSEEGRRVMKAEARPDLPLPGRGGSQVSDKPRSGKADGRKPRNVSASSTSVNADQKLLARLKSWRTKESHRRGVPPYVIFHDKTLVAIATVRPQDRESLLHIKGLGPAKLDQYGDTVLEIVRANAGSS
jgi:ATP-dependent DNA helicase RecQ